MVFFVDRFDLFQLRHGHLPRHLGLIELLKMSRGDLQRSIGRGDVGQLLQLPDRDLRRRFGCDHLH